jgi:hypothetical protein
MEKTAVPRTMDFNRSGTAVITVKASLLTTPPRRGGASDVLETLASSVDRRHNILQQRTVR